jgi:hypothetical protein
VSARLVAVGGFAVFDGEFAPQPASAPASANADATVTTVDTYR